MFSSLFIILGVLQNVDFILSGFKKLMVLLLHCDIV